MANLQAKLITDNNITLVLDGITYTVTRGNPAWNGIIKALKEKNYDDLPNLVDPNFGVKQYEAEGFTVTDEQVFYNGQPLDPALSKVLHGLIRDGIDVDPYLEFMENLDENPSYRAREQLYRFIEANKITLTDDGCLLLYKNVRRQNDGNLVDIYTGKISNNVGQIVEMDRTKVDDDPNRTCSRGLHVCSLEYLKSYPGDVTVLVKVSPEDVVSIPVDYHNSKMRVCRYEVIGEHTGGYDEEATQASVYGYEGQSDDYFDDDYFDDGDVTSYNPDDIAF